MTKASLPVLDEYDRRIGEFREFGQKLHNLLSSILDNGRVATHSINYRVKQRQSLSSKIARPQSAYKSLSEITDIVGIRIITYFAEDVDSIASIIENEFAVDIDNSTDKRAALDPDRFGYLSMHHVVSLQPNRTGLTEYARFLGMKAEIQTRSILQHAWAEIEHDLGYKSSATIPRGIRRKFSRLAGLLEIADQEFGAIREELSDYEKNVAADINRAPGTVDLNRLSLTAFVEQSAVVANLDKRIAAIDGGSLNGGLAPDHSVGALTTLGVRTIAELEKALESRKDILVTFGEQFLSMPRANREFRSGVSLLYLVYVMAAESHNPDIILDLCKRNNFGGGPDYSELVKRIERAYQEAATNIPAQ